MNKPLRCITISALWLVTSSSLASTPVVLPKPDPVTGTWNIGMQAGGSVLEADVLGATGSSSAPDSYAQKNLRLVGGFHIGYDWMMQPDWSLGVETGYRYLGGVRQYHRDTNSVDTYASKRMQGISNLLTAQYFVDQHFGVFAKVGAMVDWGYQNIKADSGAALASNAHSKRWHISPEYQIGLIYRLVHWSFTLAYDQVLSKGTKASSILAPDAQPNLIAEPYISSILLGANYFWDSVGRYRKAFTKRSGWHLGVLTGFSVFGSNAGGSDNVTTTGVSTRQQNLHWVAGAHVARDYDISSKWSSGFEMGYRYLGSATRKHRLAADAHGRSSERGVNGLLGLHYYLTPQLQFFAKAGAMLAWLRDKVNADAGQQIVRSTRDLRWHMNPEWQLGLAYRLAHWSFSLAYDKVMSENVSTTDQMSSTIKSLYTDPDISTLLLGVDYHWNGVAMPRWNPVGNVAGWHLGLTAGVGIVEPHGPMGTIVEPTSGVAPNIVVRYQQQSLRFAGGMHFGHDWQFKKHSLLGFETGYRYLGGVHRSYTDSNNAVAHGSSRLQGVNGLLVGRFFVMPHINFFGKVGGVLEWMHRKINADSGMTFAVTSRGVRWHINPEWQLGLAYRLANWSLSIAYDRIMGEGVRAGDPIGARPTNFHNGNTYEDPSISTVLLGADYWMTGAPMAHWPDGLHRDGWHVGLQAGASVLETHNQSDIGSLVPTVSAGTMSEKNAHAVGGIHLARDYAVRPRWLLGWEAGYRYLGRSLHAKYATSADVHNRNSVQGVNGLLALRYYLTPHATVFAKAGAMLEWLHYKVHSDSTATDAVSTRMTRWHVDPEWQLGFAYRLMHWSFSLAYDRVVGEGVTSINPSNSNLSHSTYTNPSVSSVLLGADYWWQGVQIARWPAGLNFSGWSMGVDTGFSVMEIHNPADYIANSIVKRMYQRNVNPVGGLHLAREYQLNGHILWGIESGYRFLGYTKRRNTISGATARSHNYAEGVNGLFTARYFMTPHVNVFAKAGAVAEWQRMKTSSEGGTVVNKRELRWHANPEWQLGVGYRLNQWSFSLAYDRIIGLGATQIDPMSGSETSYDTLTNYLNPSISTVLVSANYHF